ncbi:MULTISPECIES: DUF2238 domain-containing protein [Pasteurellaceae]|uniref:Membrane protein, PF09997 family n=1 Tax=Pasteurella bettyae CCUG 2042 TaxID=1095749 RepID=I3D6E3_9PAST|nr:MULTISPECIES: DUF2238 domain-containing protein [Pasteurellaceae]EIJ67286.1 membrane protein, PF09997 family [Pasteurella bettyae CCUG 2042]SUB21188.1 transmembrane protein [Pasteurella bettyae]
MKNIRWFPIALMIFITVLSIWSAIEPLSRAVWYAEVLPIFTVFGLLIITYPWFKFSNWAYFCMSLWLIFHLIGAHYTFEHVPFQWASDLLSGWLGEGRNHFDRVAHYSIGFYSFPMAEFLLRRKLTGPIVAGFFALFFIMSVAASYELIEWQYAVIAGGEEGIAFLGSQGDIWDAQKDILADTLGAISGLILFYFTRPDKQYS